MEDIIKACLEQDEKDVFSGVLLGKIGENFSAKERAEMFETVMVDDCKGLLAILERLISSFPDRQVAAIGLIRFFSNQLGRELDLWKTVLDTRQVDFDRKLKRLASLFYSGALHRNIELNVELHQLFSLLCDFLDPMLPKKRLLVEKLDELFSKSSHLYFNFLESLEQPNDKAMLVEQRIKASMRSGCAVSLGDYLEELLRQIKSGQISESQMYERVWPLHFAFQSDGTISPEDRSKALHFLQIVMGDVEDHPQLRQIALEIFNQINT